MSKIEDESKHCISDHALAFPVFRR